MDNKEPWESFTKKQLWDAWQIQQYKATQYKTLCDFVNSKIEVLSQFSKEEFKILNNRLSNETRT